MRPPYEVATWPSEFFVNAQDGLPAVIQRHAEDVRALGPGGVFFTDEPLAYLRFGLVLEQFERDNADATKYVRLSDLLKRCCGATGVPFEEVPTPSDAAVQERTKAHEAAVAARKKAPAAEEAAEAAEDEDAAALS